MCLLALAWRVHPDFPLVLVGNRDEFHDRPAEPAHWWSSPDGILAGRDLQAGGSWLGLSLRGRLAVVTNYREPGIPTSGRRSRGDLVVDFLSFSGSVVEWMDELTGRSNDYGGFNLIVGDREQIHYLTNRGEGQRCLTPGVHALSNHQLNTPWPKVTAARRGLERLVKNDGFESGKLFELLADRTPADDEHLPDTGVSLEWERLLSSAFIVDPRYGTRVSTVVLAGIDGRFDFEERRFDPDGRGRGDARFSFLPSPPTRR